MKAVVFTLGCKVNRTESEGLMKELADIGYEVVDYFTVADLYIINTCAITNDAESKSRQAVARALAKNKDAQIIVIGCASQNDFSQFENVRFVSGTAGKKLAPLLGGEGVKLAEVPKAFEEFNTRAAHTRAFIKVQDGCNNFCAYCIVPYLRGRSRSRGIKSILAEIDAQEGIKEIVLTGINISKYGLDTGSSLKELLLNVRHDKRLRLGSLEVGVIDDELLNVLSGNKNFCDHFHLSLQSMSDKVLKDMNRHNSAEDVFRAVGLIREYFPSAGITADIIAGFVGETEEEHKETSQNLAQLALSDIHVFPYSMRNGTAASKLADTPAEIKKRRAAELAKIASEAKGAFLRSQIGTVAEVLTEKGGSGLSKNYTRVYLPNGTPANEILSVKLTEPTKGGFKGEIL